MADYILTHASSLDALQFYKLNWFSGRLKLCQCMQYK